MGRKVRLEVLSPRTRAPDPKVATVLIRGEGDVDFICGACYAVLLEGLEFGQVQAAGSFECPSCGAECGPPKPIGAG